MVFNVKQEAINQIKSIVNLAFKSAIDDKVLNCSKVDDFIVETSNNEQNGDFATNAAMTNSKSFKMSPHDIACILKDYIDLKDSYFEYIEVKGPGFINFFLNDTYYYDSIKTILNLKDEYGVTDKYKGKKILVEFVSANPTGPMHIGNARGGAIGDVLCEIYKKCGYISNSEFYLNDAGNQIEKFAKSLSLRYLALCDGEENHPFSEDLYQGIDIIDHAKEFKSKYGDKYLKCDEKEREKALIEFCLPKNINELKTHLKKYRIEFDRWYSETSLYENKLIDKTIQMLKDKGYTFLKDGALWFKTTKFGLEKDDVLIRANQIPTYFAADIAYHYEKIAIRGYDKLINVWGADHHGHVDRLKAALRALGLEDSKLHVVLMQMVRLIKDKKTVKASKRMGNAITLDYLLDLIPIDAARFFFNLRQPSSHFDFDLDVAVLKTNDNPVYYVQYAHARICSILKNLETKDKDFKEDANYSLLNSSDEKNLIKLLSNYPNVIIEAGESYDPSLLTKYSIDLATAFHRFYTSCNIKNSEDELKQARLNLSYATKITLKNLLKLLKIEAKESM